MSLCNPGETLLIHAVCMYVLYCSNEYTQYNDISCDSCTVDSARHWRILFHGYEYTKVPYERSTPVTPCVHVSSTASKCSVADFISDSATAISRFSSLFASSYHGSLGLRASAANMNNSEVWWRSLNWGNQSEGGLLSRSSRTSNLQPAVVLCFFDVKQNHVIMMNPYDFGKALRRSSNRHKLRHRLSLAKAAEVKPSRKLLSSLAD
jgi:hypothetical protein